MKRSKQNETTHRKTQKRRKRVARSGARTQAEIIQDRFLKKGKSHPAKAYAEKVKEGSTLFYPFIKYQDIGRVPAGGRLVEEWYWSEIVPLFPRFRKGKGKLPKSFHFWDHAYLMDYFGLRAWEFGNWLTNEDRMNYVCGSGIALYDMRSVLQFPTPQMGLQGMVSLAIGARGKSSASAHFEPHTFAINLTRYSDNPGPKAMHYNPFLKKYPKVVRFLRMGGVGSLAHEYGHALDYFFGGFVDQDAEHFALTGGRSVRTRPDHELMKKKTLRGYTEKLIHNIIWETDTKQSRYYSELRALLKEKKIKSNYYYRRNELFARFFEQYIQFKLKQKGLQNRLLHKPKYDNVVYLPQKHLEKLVPIMDKLVAQMRVYLKKQQ
ncbi:MAG: LPD1 domain-containing protein [Bacteroidota bacterium]